MVLAQPRRIDVAIIGEPGSNVLQRPVLCRTWQARRDVGGERLLPRRAHPREPVGGRRDHRIGEVRARAGPAQYVHVEGGEIDEIEDHRPAALLRRCGEIGSRPVENGHEIVAHGVYAAGGEIAQALGIALQIAAPVAGLRLDGFGDRQALDHLPGEPRRRAVGMRRDLALALLDIVDRPDRAGRHMMERRDDPLGAGLTRVGDRHLVERSEPAPCLSH